MKTIEIGNPKNINALKGLMANFSLTKAAKEHFETTFFWAWQKGYTQKAYTIQPRSKKVIQQLKDTGLFDIEFDADKWGFAVSINIEDRQAVAEDFGIKGNIKSFTPEGKIELWTAFGFRDFHAKNLSL